MTIICKCEDITAEEVEAAIAGGRQDIESIKRYTGLATGVCQGRYCIQAAREILRGCVPSEEITKPKDIVCRIPIALTPLSALAGLKGRTDGER